MKVSFPRAALVALLVSLSSLGAAQTSEEQEDDDKTPPKTVFTFGGYAKVDALSTTYHDGSPEAEAAIRFFHLPAQIPVAGQSDLRRQADAHANESRFYFDLNRTLENDWDLRVYIELDFLLSGQGDERISNSFNPRMRHFYFSAGPFLFGQDWTTFQILELPDDLDFVGAADGVIFIRQPQVRFTWGPWQLALENPETTLDPLGGGERITTEAGTRPDFIARYNLGGDWGSLSFAGLLRRLNHEYEEDDVATQSTKVTWGFTSGGRLRLGERDDLRFQASGGRGLGRYAAVGFANAGVVTPDNEIQATSSVLGFVGYRHFWSDQFRSNVNASGIGVSNDPDLAGDQVNRSAYSLSANFLWSPLPELTFGVEYMTAWRELESRARGRFERLQFSARYDFGFSVERVGDDP